MDPLESLIISIVMGVAMTAFVVWRLQIYRETAAYHESQKRFIKFLKWEERMVLEIQKRITKWFSRKKIQRIDPTLLLEILLIGIWAFWVGREYLNFDPNILPHGREFGHAIQSHHMWTRFRQCGYCAIWNGSVLGGYPAFADIYGGVLHPFIILSTLILGVVSGVKITLVLSLWIAGIAQWWIAYELKVSRIPRLWSSGIAVVGGHLAGRMEQGSFGLVFSTAMASLVFGAILSVANGKGKRASVLLAITLTSALISGQGYLQVGLAGAFPALLFLIFDRKFKLKNTWRYFVLAFIIAGLLSAVFIIPFSHFYPNFEKYTDFEFKLAQPFKYIPLNYVINSFDYYHSNTLDKYPYPTLYALFIGWIPIVLGIYGLTDNEKISKFTKWYFITSILLILSFGSADALKLLTKIWEGAAGIRHPSIIAGLTVPLILGLSAIGVDKLLRLDWPKLEIHLPENEDFRIKAFSMRWLLIMPLVFSLYQGYRFTEMWLYTQKAIQEVPIVLEGLKTETLQWVQPPFGEHFFVERAIGMGLKISPGAMDWRWKDRNLPEAFLEASRSGQPSGTSGIRKKIGDIIIYTRPEQEYAIVTNGSDTTPCQAQGIGGNLSVTCQSDHGGHLIIKENNWSGWRGWMDGKEISIFGAQWISAEVPSGYHVFTFRYLPWDVPLGIGLSVIGIILSVLVWNNKISPLDNFLND